MQKEMHEGKILYLFLFLIVLCLKSYVLRTFNELFPFSFKLSFSNHSHLSKQYKT
jgi:hypothetical protein